MGASDRLEEKEQRGQVAGCDKAEKTMVCIMYVAITCCPPFFDVADAADPSTSRAARIFFTAGHAHSAVLVELSAVYLQPMNTQHIVEN
ncbi:hypothetical protein BWP39_07465 [Paraburkholderia acidicola]|uniref:Uncharacterized protein n=1 Tax=Paraburkholderia acidicola TaxID=1912599 RepID=A0A2A4F7M3_9BURK|nr:hypothetical protein [Paraburkholderia acidicola]PCE28349.1 hypothetical protein BWP39_07465 [Paraburkholderia acidicola]